MPTAIQRRLQKAEQDAARKRASEAFARFEAAVESISDDQLAAWWYGMQQNVDRAGDGDHLYFEEPARSGVRAWSESGAAGFLKAFCDEYDNGPLPAREAPGAEVVIPEWRVERVREKGIALTRKYGEPVQKAAWHPAHPANAEA